MGLEDEVENAVSQLKPLGRSDAHTVIALTTMEGGVWLIQPDGSCLMKLVPLFQALRWFPGHEQLLCSVQSKGLSLYTLGAEAKDTLLLSGIDGYFAPDQLTEMGLPPIERGKLQAELSPQGDFLYLPRRPDSHSSLLLSKFSVNERRSVQQYPLSGWGDLEFLAISPRGDQIAYTREGMLYLLSLSSQATPLLPKMNEKVRNPVWLSQSKILFHNPSRQQLVFLDLATSQKTFLNFPGFLDPLEIAPDYSTVAFICETSVVLVQANGVDYRILTEMETSRHHPCRVSDLSWSPDSKALAYTTERSGHTKVMITDLSGTSKLLVKGYMKPRWS